MIDETAEPVDDDSPAQLAAPAPAALLQGQPVPQAGSQPPASAPMLLPQVQARPQVPALTLTLT